MKLTDSRLLASEIEVCIPNIRVKKYCRITTGWENLVLEVNGEYIFRFPMFRGGWARIKGEMAFLPLVSPQLTFAVPNYELVWPGNRRHPQKFGGYRKIPGVPCTKEVFRRKLASRLGSDLGHFLTELHSLHPPLATRDFITSYNRNTWAELRSRFYRRVRRLVYPLLDAKERKWAEDFWIGSNYRMSKADFEPVLIYSNMRGGNMIIEPTNGELRGIIDWGHVAVADPALDFMGSFEVDRRLGEQVLESYGRGKSGFRDRIELYQRTVPFGEIAWGVQTGAEQFTEEGLKHLRQRLA